MYFVLYKIVIGFEIIDTIFILLLIYKNTFMWLTYRLCLAMSTIWVRVHYFTRNSHLRCINYTNAYLRTRVLPLRVPQGARTVTALSSCNCRTATYGGFASRNPLKTRSHYLCIRSMLRAIHGARVTVIIVDKPCGALGKPCGPYDCGPCGDRTVIKLPCDLYKALQDILWRWRTYLYQFWNFLLMYFFSLNCFYY